MCISSVLVSLLLWNFLLGYQSLLRCLDPTPSQFHLTLADPVVRNSHLSGSMPFSFWVVPHFLRFFGVHCFYTQYLTSVFWALVQVLPLSI